MYYKWFSARLQYLHCTRSEDTAILQYTINIRAPNPAIGHIETNKNKIVIRMQKSLYKVHKQML